MPTDQEVMEIFQSRPFKTRNADEFPIEAILDLYVNPIDGLNSPFDFENTIIKGRMGSGKTMYLKANHAYYISTLVPSLIDGDAELILPVFVRMSDFQHLQEPDEIYRGVIINIVEGLTSVYERLQDSKELAAIHLGMRQLPIGMLRNNKVAEAIKRLNVLSADEYITKVGSEFGLNGGAKPTFFELSAQYRHEALAELKRKPHPGIKDVFDCYQFLLEDQAGKILLLIDEAGSLDRSFYRDDDNKQCLFEILMNQLRTASFIRTKIAVYPNSFEDMLTETRYGDVVALEDGFADTGSYRKYRKRTLTLIENYLNRGMPEGRIVRVEDMMECSPDREFGDAIEQLMYASGGNMRRMIHLLDIVMNIAYTENGRPTTITKEHAIAAIRQQAEDALSLFSVEEGEFLNGIATVCRSRGAFKFKYPNVPLYKYTSRSREYNLVKVDQPGMGRRGTVYSFDYAFAVLKDIPTHHQRDTEKIYKERSLDDGVWISRITTINKELMDNAEVPGKVDGTIDYLTERRGFIKNETGDMYYFDADSILETDRGKVLHVGKMVRFYPANVGDILRAVLVEVL